MLRIKGKTEDMDIVKMPSECLQIYRTISRVQKEHSISGLYWAIELLPKNERVAHLIKESERPQYQRPGIRSVIPAYRKD
jgi:hypothetical protein